MISTLLYRKHITHSCSSKIRILGASIAKSRLSNKSYCGTNFKPSNIEKNDIFSGGRAMPWLIQAATKVKKGYVDFFQDDVEVSRETSNNDNAVGTQGSQKKSTDDKRGDKSSKIRIPVFKMILISGLVLYFLGYITDFGNFAKDITWREFENDILSCDKLADITLKDGNTLVIRTKNHLCYRLSFLSSDKLMEKLSESCQKYGLMLDDIKFSSARAEKSSYSAIWTLIGLVCFYNLCMWIIRMKLRNKNVIDTVNQMSNEMFPFSRKVFETYKPSKSTVTFKDIKGCDEALKETLEFVEFLKNPQTFTRLGAKMPKGAILFGPPGTGKTLMAKAVAGEAGVPFIYSSGSEFIEMIAGVGAKRVREIFQQAKKNSPCIVFIDEIDAIGVKRDGEITRGEHDQTLNQLLCELDGFGTDNNVVLLCGTNQYDRLDSALIRPGRLDRKICLSPPGLDGRVELFDLYLSKISVDQNVRPDYAKRLAGLTPGSTGADIATICNEGAIIAARQSKDMVTINDLEKAIDRLVLGNKLNKNLSAQEKRTVAVHESGHAIVSWFLKNTLPILKISIVPRGTALGVNQLLPSEDHLVSKDQLSDMVTAILGGRAAEELILGTISSGATDDLMKVTQIMYQKVGMFGMHEDIGLVSYPSIRNRFTQQSIFSTTSEYGPDVANKIDVCVNNAISSCYDRAKNIIQDNKDLLLKLSDVLFEKEVMSTNEIEEILGKRPEGSLTVDGILGNL